ncbi:MAG: FAD-binding oxidoreductase, partial [Chitinophagales bacterium]|nr:FAD-binding oxidoreductase [Chitinophagales bacterium]
IVGGGMAGLMCAHEFVLAGKKVVIIEKDFCGAGASGKSSGFISPDSELELSDLISNYGKDDAKTLWTFVCDGVSLIKNTIEQYHLQCDFQVQDACYIATNKGGIKNIVAEHDARESLGYDSTFYKQNNLNNVLGSDSFHGGVRYPDTFGIDGFHYCHHFANQLEQMGVRIFEQSPVTEVGHQYVKAGAYTASAKVIVLCADYFLPQLGFLWYQLFQMQTFLAISKPLSEEQVKKIFPEKRMMVWDSKLIYNYFRITGDNRLLLGGANLWYTYTRKENHDPEQSIKRLDKFFSKKFPKIKIEWEFLWPGMVGVSKDVLPVAGQSKDESSHYYIAAAAGLPWAAALGKYVAEKILKPHAHPLDKYFSPYRKFPVSKRVEKIIGKPLSFLLSHFIIKYFGKIY